MRILITGKGSYIGRSLKAWLEDTEGYIVDELDMENPNWTLYDFTPYDTVIHVAAIVHKKKKEIDWSTYYRINTILPYQVAKKTRESKVRHFIFLSTMAVYGQGKKLPTGNIIDKKTPLRPKSYYGRSKLMAELKLITLNSKDFRISIVRPPNVYGYACPGNYISSFVKLVKLMPIIPATYTDCRQGFIYIDNLCSLIQQLINDRRPGIFHPQDGEGVSSFTLLSEIAPLIHRKPLYSYKLGKMISFLHKLPIVIKIFGGVSYSSSLSNKPYNNYSRVDFKNALRITITGSENKKQKSNSMEI
jgi:UDP-glucose 4-epimerase